jgi:hypothetical protein
MSDLDRKSAEIIESAWSGRISPLISAEEIQKKVSELGEQITRDYTDREVVLVGVLKGSFLFMADLCRCIKLPITCDFLGVSSYGDDTKTSGVIRITSDLKRPIEDKHVLVVEDIVDTGKARSAPGPDQNRLPGLFGTGCVRRRLWPGLQGSPPESGLHRNHPGGLTLF